MISGVKCDVEENAAVVGWALIALRLLFVPMLSLLVFHVELACDFAVTIDVAVETAIRWKVLCARNDRGRRTDPTLIPLYALFSSRVAKVLC